MAGDEEEGQALEVLHEEVDYSTVGEHNSILIGNFGERFSKERSQSHNEIDFFSLLSLPEFVLHKGGQFALVIESLDLFAEPAGMNIEGSDYCEFLDDLVAQLFNFFLGIGGDV